MLSRHNKRYTFVVTITEDLLGMDKNSFSREDVCEACWRNCWFGVTLLWVMCRLQSLWFSFTSKSFQIFWADLSESLRWRGSGPFTSIIILGTAANPPWNGWKKGQMESDGMAYSGQSQDLDPSEILWDVCASDCFQSWEVREGILLGREVKNYSDLKSETGGQLCKIPAGFFPAIQGQHKLYIALKKKKAKLLWLLSIYDYNSLNTVTSQRAWGTQTKAWCGYTYLWEKLPFVSGFVKF